MKYMFLFWFIFLPVMTRIAYADDVGITGAIDEGVSTALDAIAGVDQDSITGGDQSDDE